ncbi:hypothetical protein BJL96_33330 [Burkholderia cenocepacia]|nr:hypothetical protein WM33_02655 [Burkholderia multivorans]KVR78297.1 hypothetical protein WK26_19790 [Burkholderia vietnamiensis]NGO91872.1 hypothetical protein [Burkholderia cenocepacia]KVS10342.1 hypothetical protein WK29_20120 [Burkholderia vietnamiensis]KVS35752.1 hypothetical protein WK35_03285 [Burkholderia vietnamiensis]
MWMLRMVRWETGSSFQIGQYSGSEPLGQFDPFAPFDGVSRNPANQHDGALSVGKHLHRLVDVGRTRIGRGGGRVASRVRDAWSSLEPRFLKCHIQTDIDRRARLRSGDLERTEYRLVRRIDGEGLVVPFDERSH